MKWSRYCQHCGYAVSQLDPACPRCGKAEEDAATPQGKSQATHGLGERPGRFEHVVPIGARHRAGPPLAWLLLAGGVLLGLEAAALSHYWLRPAADSHPALPTATGALTGALSRRNADRALPPGRQLPAERGAPDLGLPLPSGIGRLFDAQPSMQVTPLIAMTNRSQETICFQFQGPTAVSQTIPPSRTIEFELPRGKYRVQAWFRSAPSVQTGTAVFQERTRYTSTWQIVRVPPWEAGQPLRMGDIE